MKIAIACALPILAALACAPPLPPAAAPTPKPTQISGAVIQIPREHQVELTLVTPTPPANATPESDLIQAAATSAANALNGERQPLDATPQPDNAPAPEPTTTSTPASADEMDEDAPSPSEKPLPMRPIKRNPPIGALGSYLSDMVRDAEKPGADLVSIANAAPISQGESIAITLLGAFSPSEYTALRESLIDIGADIRNESRLADATAIEMYIPVSSLRALSSLSPGIHRIEPIIPPQADTSQSPQLPMQPAQTAMPTIENGKSQVAIGEFLGMYGGLAYTCPDSIMPGNLVPGTQAHLDDGTRGDEQWRRTEDGCERTDSQ